MSTTASDFQGLASGSAQGLRLVSAAVIFTTLLAVVFQFVIVRVYADLIVQLFGGAREGHLTGGIEIPVSYICTALTAAATAMYCERRTGPSRVMLVIHLVAVIIPLQALVAAQFELARPEFASAVAMAYLGSLLLVAMSPEVRVPRAGRLARAVLLLLAFAASMYTFAALLAHGGVTRFSFDLSAIYEVRDDFLRDLAPFLGYLVPWSGGVLMPALMLLGLKRRSWILGLAGLVLQLALFAMTGFKAFLLMPALLLGLYVVGGRRHLAAVVLAGMMFIVAVALVAYAWLDAPVVPALLVDRVIIVPAELHYWYYDFFGVHGALPLQLSQSIFSSLSASHYTVPIAEVIGWKYMGQPVSANVGMFADAYANFGFAGCAIFALLFAAVLKAMDAVSHGLDPRISAALVGMAAFQLVNSGLLTTMLTGGLLLTIVVLWVFPHSRRASSN